VLKIVTASGAYALTPEFVAGVELTGLPPEWVGRGSELLGVLGIATPEQKRALLSGFSPSDGVTPLRRNAGRGVGAYEFNTSYDATVRAFFAALPVSDWGQFVAASDAAARVQFDYLEKECAFVRTGAGGKVVRKAGVAVLLNTQLAGRFGPQPHRHDYVVNVGVLETSGRTVTYALDGRPLYEAQRASDALHQLEFCHGLQTKFGVRAEASQRGFRLTDLPADYVRAFGFATERIDAFLAERGLPNTPVSRTFAYFQTRPKERLWTRSELADLCARVTRAHEFDVKTVVNGHEPKDRPPGVAAVDATRLVIRASESFGNKVVFSHHDLVATSARAAIGTGISAREVIEAANIVRQYPHVVGLTVVRDDPEQIVYARSGPPQPRRTVQGGPVPGTKAEGRVVQDQRVRDLDPEAMSQVREVLASTRSGYVGRLAREVAGYLADVYRAWRHPVIHVRGDLPPRSPGSVEWLLKELKPMPRWKAHIKAWLAVQKHPLLGMDRALGYMTAVYARCRRPRVRLTSRTVVVVEAADRARASSLADLERRVTKAGAQLSRTGATPDLLTRARREAAQATTHHRDPERHHVR
jgi:hypothetical protein